MRSGSLAVSASADQRVALDVGGEHEVDEAFRAGRRFLVDAADARAFRNDERAALWRELPANEAEERRLPAPLRADEPDMRARRQRRAGVVDQERSPRR